MEINFCSTLDEPRATKLKIHLLRQGMKRTEFLEKVIDNIHAVQSALDATVMGKKAPGARKPKQVLRYPEAQE